MTRRDSPFDSQEETAGFETEAMQLPEVVPDVVAMHREIALRLTREGHHSRAFTEMVRASRSAAMTQRLASTLVHVALAAQTHLPAESILKSGIIDADESQTVSVRRQLVRLLRRSGDTEGAREALVELLAATPGDRRARAVLHSILSLEQRFEELDASLERATREALRVGALQRAAKEAALRGRLWGEKNGDHSRAALRFMQAAQYAEQSKNLESAFEYRLSWVKSLTHSKAPKRAIDEATAQTLLLAKRVNRTAYAVATIALLTQPSATFVSSSGELTPPPEVEQAASKSSALPGAAQKKQGLAGPIPSPQVANRSTEKSRSGLRELLSKQIEASRTDEQRSNALILRAEEALTRQETALARVDFEAAISLMPLSAAAHAGLSELSAMQGDYGPIREFEFALRQVPKNSSGRGELFRRLARLVDTNLKDARLSAKAWQEVRAEIPNDTESGIRLGLLKKTFENERTSPHTVASKAPADQNIDRENPRDKNGLPGGPLLMPIRAAGPSPVQMRKIKSIESMRTELEIPIQPWPAQPSQPPRVGRRAEVESPALSQDDEILEVGSAEVEMIESETFEIPRKRTQEIPVELGDDQQHIAPSYFVSPSRALSNEREMLFERLQQKPLESDGYKLLAEHFDSASDAARSSLMLEIARALDGDPNAAPRTPRLILSSADRTGLKHASVRDESAELVGLVGAALCKMFPVNGREGGTDVPFDLASGKGARGTADALLAAVRILGLRAPTVFLSEDAGPPFSLVFRDEPRILVGKMAIKKELPDATLRFFAGRALFTQTPELMALRSLKREQFLRGMAQVMQACAGKFDSAETRLIRELIPARSWDRIRELVKQVANKLDFGALADGARHAANRAGLVVCGGIAPAVAALREKKALPHEMKELIRFASSERYLALRERQMPSK
jgi:hypothetical protein